MNSNWSTAEKWSSGLAVPEWGNPNVTYALGMCSASHGFLSIILSISEQEITMNKDRFD